MPPLKIVLPAKPQKVIVAQPTPEIRAAKESDYKGGFDAGYKAGLLQAQQEQEKLAKEQGQLIAQQLQALQKLHDALLDLTRQHLPEIIFTVLSRVMEHHQFSPEEIAKEIEILLRQLGQANAVTIECASEDLNPLQEQLERLGLSLSQASMEWKLNPNLKRGEFRLISDLGSLDGRHLVRLAEVRQMLNDLGNSRS